MVRVKAKGAVVVWVKVVRVRFHNRNEMKVNDLLLRRDIMPSVLIATTVQYCTSLVLVCQANSGLQLLPPL